MKLKKWTALALSAALATCMLTGCPWEENEENSDDASSTPGTSQGGGHSGPDDSENTGGSTGGDTGDIGGGTEEGNPDSGEEQEPEPQPQQYTFNISVKVPDNSEQKPSRWYMQVGNEKVEKLEGGTGTYTASLLPDTSYTCLFWADNAAESATAPTDLTAVSYTPGTAAYAGKITGKPSDLTSTNQTVTLKPVTTKVTIQCKGGEPGDKLTVTLNFAESFNVQSMKASSGVQEGRNIASFSSGDGNLLWESSAWKTQTTWLVQALGRLSRAGDNSNTCTVYTLLPSDLTDEQKTITIEHESCVYTTELNVENPVIDLGNLDNKDANEWKAAA